MIFDEQLVTVWSAPNYCYRCGNTASVMEFDEHLNRGFKKFDCAPTEDRNKFQIISCNMILLIFQLDLRIYNK